MNFKPFDSIFSIIREFSLPKIANNGLWFIKNESFEFIFTVFL